MSSRRARQRRQQEQFEQQSWKEQRDQDFDIEEGLVEFPDDDTEPGYSQETFR